MEAFLRARQFFHGIWAKFRPKRKQNTGHFITGLPAGITPETLNTICMDYFNDRPLSYTYQHLSGWKPTGAYRLVIKTHRGNEIRLVFKDSVYLQDQIPALIDLPVRPGPPEFAIYSRPTGALAAFLPQVYLAEELIPGEHYRYVLEDLSQTYHGISFQKDIIRTSFLLPKLHHALQDWSTEIHPQGFLHYGKDYSASLQQYARNNLERYSQYSDDPVLKLILHCWHQIANLELQEEYYNLHLEVLIHGDTNYTNFHLHTQDPFQFRVVDWEWAGYGLPHADLASLLKGIPEGIEKTAFQKYVASPNSAYSNLSKDLPFEENWRVYLWCKLERGLLDASFLAAQFLNTAHTARFNLPMAISQSLNQVHKVYRQLSNGSNEM